MTIQRSDPHQDALRLLEQERKLAQRSKIDSYFPAAGPHRRELYPKHMEFFEAGAKHRVRAMMAGNRVGKTLAGAYEVCLHLLGRYPDWWTGRRFSEPIQAWACGDSSKTVRDIVQRCVLGPINEIGTGLLPADAIVRTTVKPGISDSIETVYVRHSSGGLSELTLKSYDQQREAFQGTSRHIVWLDEECPRDIFTECLMRTMNVDGVVLMTFTPLLGMSELCRDLLAPDSQHYVVNATWDDCPHLSEPAKAELLASIPEYQRQARSKGVPQLGSGAIYQVAEEDIAVKDFAIPDHWPRAYGLDIGWNKTACIWGARNPDTGEIFLYSEHYRGQAEPIVHAQAIQSRGKWIPGVIDPAARGRSQADGQQMIYLYQQCGLDLWPADNAVETGLYACWQLFSAGKLKAFKSLGNFFSEYRLYQRDSEGKIIKRGDHLMDAMRYLILSGRSRMRTKPVEQPEQKLSYVFPGENNQRWMN